MDMALFKTWRDDRLQDKTNKEDAMKMQVAEAKFREHEEPKKREVDEVALFSMLVPYSAQELNPAAKFFENVPHHVFQIYSKLRTVSPEWEEDDVALPCMIVLTMLFLVMLLLILQDKVFIPISTTQGKD
jgi:hypothetical protein